jgi:hypothetical protein
MWDNANAMSEDAAELVVGSLWVHDDLAAQDFLVNLEDVVHMVDDPDEPGKYRSLIITLLNDEILDRHPHAAAARQKSLEVTIEEFSEIKLQVLQRMAARGKPSSGPLG